MRKHPWRGTVTLEVTMRLDYTKPVYIYVLRDPETKAVRYVGATQHTLDERLAWHEYTAEHGITIKGNVYRAPIARWVRSLNQKGQSPVPQKIDTADASDRQEAEGFWIALYRHHGADLLNEKMPDCNPLYYGRKKGFFPSEVQAVS